MRAILRRGRVSWLSPVLAFGLVLALLAVPTTAAESRAGQAPGPTMGALVYGGMFLYPDGTYSKVPLPAGVHDINFDAVFSPDGASFATFTQVSAGQLALVVVDSQGGVRTIAQLNGWGQTGGLDWSPDGKSIAMVVAPPGGSGDGRWGVNLYRVEVATGAVSLLVQSTFALTVWPAEPSWSPKGDRIAFTMSASPNPEGPISFPAYTVPANGGAAARYNPPRFCFDDFECYDLRSGPVWAPDGSSLYAFVESNLNEQNKLQVMRIHEGAADPVPVADFSATSEAYYTAHGAPQVSLDGASIVASTLTTENADVYHRAFMISGGKVTEIRSAIAANPSDWQPCPTGSCVRWQGRQELGGQLGASCGKATFAWRTAIGSKTTVKDGEGACVFLVGNAIAQEVLHVAVKQGVSFGTAFAGTLLREGVVEYGDGAAKWGAKWLLKRELLKAMAKAVGARASAFTPITLIGKAVGLTAVPLAGLFVVSQIKNNDACVQVIVDRDSGKVKVDWSMVYAHSSSANLTKAKVYKRVDKRFAVDDYKPVPLGMTCTKRGGVDVSTGSNKAMGDRWAAHFGV